MGFRLVALMGVLTIIGLIIQIANALQSPRLPAFTPSEQISVWKRSDAALPRLNVLRGSPASAVYLYSYRASSPLLTSASPAPNRWTLIEPPTSICWTRTDGFITAIKKR